MFLGTVTNLITLMAGFFYGDYYARQQNQLKKELAFTNNSSVAIASPATLRETKKIASTQSKQHRQTNKKLNMLTTTISENHHSMQTALNEMRKQLKQQQQTINQIKRSYPSKDSKVARIVHEICPATPTIPRINKAIKQGH